MKKKMIFSQIIRRRRRRKEEFKIPSSLSLYSRRKRVVFLHKFKRLLHFTSVSHQENFFKKFICSSIQCSFEQRRKTSKNLVEELKVRMCFFNRLMILPQVHLRKPCYDFSFL